MLIIYLNEYQILSRCTVYEVLTLIKPMVLYSYLHSLIALIFDEYITSTSEYNFSVTKYIAI